MTRAAIFRQSDITRAIKAAKSAGMVVTRCEISSDGKIVLSDIAQAPAEDAFGSWQAKRDGHAQRRA